MMRRLLTGLVVVLATGCGSSPTSPESTPATVTVSGAAATAPATGTVIPYASQPVTLLATLPVATPAVAVTSFVDVATDTAFLSIVQTQPLSGDPGASVPLALAALTPGTYYWRVRTIAAAAVSSSSASSFVVSSTVPLAIPLLYTKDDVTVYPRPQLTVNRIPGGTRPIGRIKYRFDVALSTTMLPALLTKSIDDDDSAIFTIRPPDDLALDTTYYWRVTAVDTLTTASAASEVRHFHTTPATLEGRAALFVTLDCQALLPSRPPAETIAIDGSVTLSPVTVGFVALNTLRLELVRSGDRVTGSISGASGERLGGREVRVGSTPFATSGVATDSLAEGTYDGYLGAFTVGGSSNGTSCVSNNVRWKLYFR